MPFCNIQPHTDDDTFKIEVIEDKGKTTKIYIASKNTLKQFDITPIKLGLTWDALDTTQQDVVQIMQSYGKHVALTSYYMTDGGRLYRHMTPPMAWEREEEQIIKTFEEEQEQLKELIEKGYEYLQNPEILDTCSVI